MKQGLRYAKKNKAGAIIFMDGDRQHSPIHIKEFLQAIEVSPIVFGYRMLLSDAPKISGDREEEFWFDGETEV